MPTRWVAIVGAALLSGCGNDARPIGVAEGCYRFADGTPFFRVRGRMGIFVTNAGLKSFKIGSSRPDHREVQVEPAFVVHYATGIPSGFARSAEAVTTLSSGSIRYERAGDRVLLSIPVEAYGWETVQLGKAC